MKGDGGILIKRVMGTHKTGKQSIRSHPMAIGLIGVYSSNTFMIFSTDWCRVMSVDSYAIRFFCADPCRGNVPLKRRTGRAAGREKRFPLPDLCKITEWYNLMEVQGN